MLILKLFGLILAVIAAQLLNALVSGRCVTWESVADDMNGQSPHK